MLIYQDIILGIMLILLYIIGFKGIQKIIFLEPTRSMVRGLGPVFFPNLLLNLLAISAGILIFKGLYSMIKNKGKGNKFNIFINWQKLKIYCNTIIFILSIFVYQKFLPVLGFLLTTFLFICIHTTWFYFIFTNPKTIKAMKGHLFPLFARIIITNMGITISVYIIFFFVAKVPLPKGIIERIFFGG